MCVIFTDQHFNDDQLSLKKKIFFNSFYFWWPKNMHTFFCLIDRLIESIDQFECKNFLVRISSSDGDHHHWWWLHLQFHLGFFFLFPHFDFSLIFLAWCLLMCGGDILADKCECHLKNSFVFSQLIRMFGWLACFICFSWKKMISAKWYW